MVEGLHNSIMLQHIMSGKIMFSALLFEELAELAASVLSTVVQMKVLDAHTMLSTCLGCKAIVCI